MINWLPTDVVASADPRTEIASAPVLPTPSEVMRNEFDGDRSRRRYLRVAGPFDGYRAGLLETPVRISNLSLGGCFVNASHEQRDRSRLVLKIDLPQEGVVTLKAESVYHRPGFGFAVRFVDVDGETSARLIRTVEALTQGPAGDW